MSRVWGAVSVCQGPPAPLCFTDLAGEIGVAAFAQSPVGAEAGARS